jgi:ubiquitin C-terminal hydrolase
MAHGNAYKKLGRVVDGRIRKEWPTQPPFGPPRPGCSKSKGLANPRLLCFRNAVLQCLLHVPEFVRYLSRAERCSEASCQRPRRRGVPCVYCALRDLALYYWTSKRDRTRQMRLATFQRAMVLHPGRNPSDIQNPQYTFLDATRMHDAHEFFACLTTMLKHVNNHEIDRFE